MAESHYVEGLRCPWCGEPSDGALNTDQGVTEPPEPGDLTVCVYCAQPCEYTVLGLVKLLDWEKLHPENRETVENMMRFIREEVPQEMRIPPSMRGISHDR